MKAGIVGLGGMGTKHCRAYNKIEGTTLAVGIDVDENARNRFERQFRAPAYASVEEALEEVNVDVMSITSPHGHHYEQAKTLIESGIPVFIEKPMVTSTEEAIDLIERSQKKDAPIQVGYQRRYQSPFRELKKTLKSGEIGAPRMVSAYLGQDWLSGNADSWRSEPDSAGGGQLYDTGSHLLEILLWLLDAVPRSISAQVDKREQEVDVNSALALQLDTGYESVMTSVGITGESTDLTSDEHITIWGDSGRLTFRQDLHASQPTHLQVVRRGRSTYTTTFGNLANRHPTETKIATFITSVTDGETPKPSGEYGLMLAALRDAAKESWHTGTQVDLSTRLEGIHPDY